MSNTRLLKANAVHGLGSKVAFNYDDLRQQCDEYVANVEEQARQMIAEARSQADAIRRQAFEAGRTAGQQEGLKESQQLIESQAAELAEQRMTEQLRTTLPGLRAAVAAIEVERDRWLGWWEGASVRLSIAIAEKIIRKELAQKPQLTPAMIREALQLAVGDPSLKVRMHPQDLAQLGTVSDDVLQALSPLGGSAFTPDERITPGGCLIETTHGVVDARLETQLERISAELLDWQP